MAKPKKRHALVWESWENDFVIARIRAGVDDRVTAQQFQNEFPDRGRSEASVRARYAVLYGRVGLPPDTQLPPMVAPLQRPESVAEPGWRKVAAPKVWRAAEGEILEGVYLGRKAAEGQFGPYFQHMVAVDSGRVLYVSGTVIDGLFVASLAQAGCRVRIVYLGKKDSQTSENEFKDFELFVKEPDAT